MLPRANSKRQSSDCPHMRTWRNWQTRRFQVPVGDHGGSSPFVRTTQTESRLYVGSLFVLYRITNGFEGGGVCASKRFARDNPNDQQSMAQTEQPGGLFTGARRQRRKSLRPSPFVRTTQTEGRRYVGSLFALSRLTKGALFVFPEENFRAEITVNIVDKME